MAKISVNKIELVNELEQALINLSGEELYKGSDDIAQRTLDLCLTLKDRSWDRYSRSRMFMVTNAIFNKIVFEANSHGIGESPKFLINRYETLGRLLDVCWTREESYGLLEKHNTAMTWIKYVISENLDKTFLDNMLYIHKRFIYTSNRFKDRNYSDQISLAKDFVTQLNKEHIFLVETEERLKDIIEHNEVNYPGVLYMDVYDLMRETSDLIPHANFMRGRDGNFNLVFTIADKYSDLQGKDIKVPGWDNRIKPIDILEAIKSAKSNHPLDR